MNLVIWLSFVTCFAWIFLICLAVWKYGFANFAKDVRGIFEGDEKDDPRLSYGRVFSFLFLLPAFLIIGFTVYSYTAGASWQIFIGAGLAIVAALLPYGITKTAEILTIIQALKTKNTCGGKGA